MSMPKPARLRTAWASVVAGAVASFAAGAPPGVPEPPPAPSLGPVVGQSLPRPGTAPRFPGPGSESPYAPPTTRPTAAQPAPLPVSPSEALPGLRVDAVAGAPGCAPVSVSPIDLAGALKLAGVENPEILIARQRVVLAVAFSQLAAAQILPSINIGTNYDAHTGPLQQSNGNILKVNRTALYVGAGANAVAAGTVNIPGVSYNLNLSEALIGGLVRFQGVARARYASLAVRNDVFRRVGEAYSELLHAEGQRSIALQVRDEAAEVARVTAVFAKVGQAAKADADRAANELDRRQSDLAQAEVEVPIASARLAELLGLDRNVRLHAIEDRVVPTPIVPDPIPLAQLLAIAMLQRPELAEKQAAIRQAFLVLTGAKLLPFSPNLIVGFSAGGFGGGSGLISGPQAATFGVPQQPRFGTFAGRNDFDAIAYWTIQNMGLGNLALIRTARSRVSIAELEKLEVLNRVRREVADAYVRAHVRFAQLGRWEKAVRTGDKAFHEDFRRVQGGVGRPIELLESLRLLARARYAYLRAIVDYNEAQIDLYVALGQPPADVLARPVPTDFRAPLPVPAGKQPAGK